ncbi:hypothetical protein EK21DRAFT_112566 [Setomelanomma holmii]|uniref:Uncharacterized protein n=1 Tax=Setomelanomma holmii TaxID=210430 RepID=A0A9P4H7X0_9PLEO|nr:hypothetical protein EK21DRAFT_112566 [Setomelanomma holmii]
MDRDYIYSTLRKYECFQRMGTWTWDKCQRPWETSSRSDAHAYAYETVKAMYFKSKPSYVPHRHAAETSELFKIHKACMIEDQSIKKMRDKLYEDVMQHIAAHATEECLAVCDRIQQLLPRQLRDLVYLHLLDIREDFHIGGPYPLPQEAEVAGDRRAYSQNNTSLRINSHIVEEAHVGSVELLDIIYVHYFAGSTVDIEQTDFRARLEASEQESPVAFSIEFVERCAQTSHARGLPEASTDELTRYEMIRAWYITTNFRFKDHQAIPMFLQCDGWGSSYNASRLVRRVELLNLGVGFDPRGSLENVDKTLHLEIALASLNWLRSGSHIRLTFKTLGFHEEQTRHYERNRSKDQLLPLYMEHLSKSFPLFHEHICAGRKVTIYFAGELVFEVKVEELTTQHWLEKAEVVKQCGKH